MGENVIGRGNIVEIVQYEVDIGGGKMKMFEKARRSPGVRCIVENAEGKILLSKEWRYELEAWDFRLPGGKVFDSLDEYKEFLESGKDIEPLVLEAGKNELREEVGILAQSALFFFKKVCGATMEWDLYYVVVKEWSFADGHDQGEGEQIDGFEWYGKDEVRDMLEQGKVDEGRSVATLLYYISG